MKKYEIDDYIAAFIFFGIPIFVFSVGVYLFGLAPCLFCLFLLILFLSLI